MKLPKPERLVALACVLGLVGLVLVVTSVLVPKPIPVFVALTAGQVVGTASLSLFLLALLRKVPPAAMLLALAALPVTAGCRGPEGSQGDPGVIPTPFNEAEETFSIVLTSADVAADTRNLSIAFRVVDDEGVPRLLEDLTLSWTAAVLGNDPDTGGTRWTSYFTRTVTGAFGTTDQPTSDNAGTYGDLGGGAYRYTFSAPLPAGYDAGTTHRVALIARRVDVDYEDGYEIENDSLDFVPAGGPVVLTRDIVETENCNTCHDPLAAHGEVRREIAVCVTCHNPGLYDPDTQDIYNPTAASPGLEGQGMHSLDMKVMTHRIHQGTELPSILAAAAAGITDFQFEVIGYNSRQFVFAETLPDNTDAGTAPQVSGVTFPRNQQNCTVCHTGGADSEAFKTTVTREACTACHDTTFFGDPATTPPRMENHVGGPFADDALCATCHPAGDGSVAQEFGLSVLGAHTVPNESQQLPGLAFTVENVAVAGTAVTLTFSVHNGDGTPVTNISAGAGFTGLAAIVNGPTSDYRFENLYRADVRTLAVYDAMSVTWTVVLPPRPATDPHYPLGPVIPPGATGTFAVGLEGRRTVAVTGFGNVTEAGPNVVGYFSVSGPVMPRRTVVSTDSCNVCHDRLALHGGQRSETEHCVLCHNPSQTDWARRPKIGGPGTNVNLAATEDGLEERSVDFRTMIHKIHTGDELDASAPYAIYGFGGSLYLFDEVRFPGDLTRCTTCHEEDTYLIESVPEDALPVTANETGTIMHLGTAKHQPGEPTVPPITSACIACHDSDAARVHAEINTSDAGEESCLVCHGEERAFSVRDVHHVED